MSDEDSEREFVKTVLGNFTPMEAQMGEGAYKAQIENANAFTELVLARAQIRRLIAAGMGLLLFFCILCGLPLVVLLWKVALQA